MYKFQSFLVRPVIEFNYTTVFSIQSTIIENLRIRCKISAIPCKTCVFLTIQPYFRYKVLFSSLENLVSNVKLLSFFVKTVFLNYTTRFSLQSTIFFYRKPRFRCKVSVFPCKNCVFLTIQADFRYIILFSSVENIVFDAKYPSFIYKTVLLTI